MKFGIFYEHQLPRPWNDGAEHRLLQEALDQVELADQLGIDYAWEASTIFSRNTRTPPPPKSFSPPARNAPSRSGSAMASA